MSQDPIPPSRDVYDPDLGSDGGGHSASSGMPGMEDTQSTARPATGIVCCPTCGSGVAPDRIRQG